jgi:hypothetical protein
MIRILSKNGLSAGQGWEMNQRPQLEGANAVRFWAAMSIVLFHLVLLRKKDLPAFLWVIPSFGGFGAPLFYVLSAFALSYGNRGRNPALLYAGCRKADGTDSGGSTLCQARRPYLRVKKTFACSNGLS